MNPGPISHQLLIQLRRIEPSYDGARNIYPCQVKLRSGETIDYVYLYEANHYIETWGVWPDEDPGKKNLPIEDVLLIEESPSRISTKVANKIYAGGESGMGYVAFTLILKDGGRIPYVTGNLVDFPHLPEGVSPEMVVDVIPQERSKEWLENRHYYFCIYSEAGDDKYTWKKQNNGEWIKAEDSSSE